LKPGAWLGNTLWQLASWPEWRRFQTDRNRLKETQEKLLEEALRRLSQTDYGRRFGVRPKWRYEEFAARVPTASYEELQPFFTYSEGLLTESVRVWEPTGGSTGGSKWIPWTATLQTEFRRAVSAWMGQMFFDMPSLKAGRGYWQLTPKTEMEPPDWLSCSRVGFESDGDYLGRLGRLLESWVIVRPEPTENDFWEATVRALRRAPDLTLMSCWSPSFLLVLKDRMGSWEPRAWWPNLQAISCWTQGPSGPFLPILKELFPGVEIVGKGLLSTEAVTTIPFQGRYPLAYRSHFFEFEAEDSTIWPAWSLAQGKRYQVVQTTGGGLTRYRSGDWVRVEGFFGQVPCLEFLGRARVSDHFGEKLSEVFVQGILACEQRFAMLGFEDEGYVLFLEPNPDILECKERVDRALMKSFTYRDCVELGQLRSLRLFVLKGEGRGQLHQIRDQQHGRLKPGPFLPDGVWSERLKGEFKD